MAMQKHPELPNVPLIMDLVSRPEDRVALEYLYATQDTGRPFLAPPGIPADRADALRKAFDDTMKDPDSKMPAARTLKPVRSPGPGCKKSSRSSIKHPAQSSIASKRCELLPDGLLGRARVGMRAAVGKILSLIRCSPGEGMDT